MSQTPNLFLYVGKNIKDEYGRSIGKVASFALTPNGKFDAVFIEQGDGKFLKHPVDQVKVDGSDITLTSIIKSGANALCDQIPLIWRKDQALKELVGKKKISPELFEELHGSFDGVLNQLKSEAQAFVEEVNKETARCTDEVRQLNYALVHLEIEHEIGKIDDKSYESAFTIVQDSIKRINVEKNDLEQTRSRLSSMLLGEPSKTEVPEKSKEKLRIPTQVSVTPELPEPPVVVYVKEIGRAGA